MDAVRNGWRTRQGIYSPMTQCSHTAFRVLAEAPWAPRLKFLEEGM